MSQRINPLNNKIGVLQIWNCNLPILSYNFNYYKNHITIKNYINNYIKFSLKKQNFLINVMKIIYTNHQILFLISVYGQKVPKNNLFIKKSIQEVVYNWLQVPFLIIWSQIYSLTFSAFILNNYIEYLIEKKQKSLKKILQQIYFILVRSKFLKKVIYSTSGIQEVKLKGFKIQISGCFESSRTQMAKIIKYTFGSNSLTLLKGYVEYSEKTIFTKFGSCGLKVWLFFEF